MYMYVHTQLPVLSALVPADILGHWPLHCLVSSPFRISTGILSKYNGGVENVNTYALGLYSYYIIG